LYSSQFKVEDGQIVHRTKLNDDGKLMSPAEFLATERDGSSANLFRSTLKPGTGSPGGESPEQNGSAVTVRVVGGGISEADQARYDQALKDGRQIVFKHETAGGQPL
jgi:hypothetical protein